MLANTFYHHGTPFSVLAPLEDVTVRVRKIVKRNFMYEKTAVKDSTIALIELIKKEYE